MLPYPPPKKRCRVLHVELTARSGSPPFLIPIVWWLIFKRPEFHLMSQIPQCQSLNIYDVNKQGPKKICVCSTCFFQSFNVTKHLYIHLLSVDVFCCQAQTNRQTTQKKTTQTCRFHGSPIPLEMYSVVMQKNVCDFPNFKGESPPHPRTIAPTSWDPNTAEPTLAPWRLTSCHGAGDENGVSAPLSPSHRCRKHSSPCERVQQPLGGSEIRYPHTKLRER